MMRRIQFYEIHEQPWCPAVIRNGVTNYLQFSSNCGNYFVNIAPKLWQALRYSGTRRIIDLCSGGGGPWFRLRHHLNSVSAEPINILLTDKYPNDTAIKKVEETSSTQLNYFSIPVDAKQVPKSLEGFRTLFLSFHHFTVESARTILQDAVDQNQGIGIFETTERRLMTLLTMLLGLVHVILITPFIRPFRWSQFFWTIVIPLVPLVVMFDGVVSCFRSYTVKELGELTSSLEKADYVWEIGWVSIPFSPLRVTYAIGYPKTNKMDVS